MSVEVVTVIDARARDLGGFTVGRVLPATARKLIGPFIFFDHMGPATFPPGPRDRRSAASAHRARDGHLSFRGGDRPS